MIKYVTYKRVSTKDQGRSGLGLDAQDRDIKVFLDSFSDEPFKVVGEFTETHSGSDNERPVMKKAIAQAKDEGAYLLVAKLDRLSRKVSFIATLMDDKQLKLKVAQMPNADNFQLHIYAALAEQERTFISERTKAALREAKARGVKLGGLRDKTMQRNKVRTEQAQQRADKLSGIVLPMKKQGMTLQAIADALNVAGHTTAQGKQWQPTSVRRIIALI